MPYQLPWQHGRAAGVADDIFIGGNDQRVRRVEAGMTHLELVARAAEKAELDEAQARAVLDAAFEAIVAEVAEGGKVVVGGFGTFKQGLKRRAAKADPKSPRKHKLVLTPSSTIGDKLDG